MTNTMVLNGFSEISEMEMMEVDGSGNIGNAFAGAAAAFGLEAALSAPTGIGVVIGGVGAAVCGFASAACNAKGW